MKSISLFLVFAGLTCAAEFVTGQAARATIGQDTFTSQIPGASPFIIGAASGLAYANGTLLVVDSTRVPASPQNHRVLLYRNIAGQLPGPKDSIRSEKRCPLCGGAADLVLGQPDFNKTDVGLTRTTFRTPTSVASDGKYVAVADTDNNRVLLWNNFPTVTGQAADLVVGQGDFTSGALNFGGRGDTPSAKGMRGPQGVWIQGQRLYVADTQNHRVLIWNSIPTQNGQAADVVLGKSDFTTFVQSDLAQATVDANPSSLLNPVSVTSDGTRLYVADLGHNRVLIWNSLPTQNAAPADIALGQGDITSTKDRNSTAANNSSQVCASNGKDTAGKDTFPALCAATLDWPRFALSDGKRLFVADGGSNRILVYNSVPTRTGQPADAVLGQISDQASQDTEDLNSSSTDPVNLRRSAADTILSPMSLAWDGENLYASDPFNRRVLVFTPGDLPLPLTGVRNAASVDIFAIGTIRFTAAPKENDEVTIKLADKEYKYKALKDDDIARVIRGLVAVINAGAGDPKVLALANVPFNELVLTSRLGGAVGEGVTFSFAASTGASITAESSGANLRGGQDAAKIAPGSLVTILGKDLSEQTASAPRGNSYPTALGGVEVYFDGIRAPLSFVSPTQINAQMPWEVNDANSVSAYVRVAGRDNAIRTTTAIAVPIIPQNPGIFAVNGTDPRPAVILHGSSFANGVISVDGAIKAGDVGTVTIGDNTYTYTVKAEDNLVSVRDALITAINDDPAVRATPAGIFTRIILTARKAGLDGEGLVYAASATTGGSLILTPLTPALCCSSQEGAPITEANPAKPGETVVIYATGLGIVQPDEAKFAQVTGSSYEGPELNQPNSFLDSLAGGKTANVLFAGLKRGQIGVYEIRLQLNSDIPTNPQTQLTIAQDVFVSNIVTFPVVNPNEEAP